MTKEEVIKRLPKPWNQVIEYGGSIDYHCKGGDHKYVEERGYTTQMNSDCSYSAPGLRGFNLSSYGDWGTFFTSWADEESLGYFIDMYEKGIIKLWRARVYLDGNGYDFEIGDGWKTYDKELGCWINCPNPLPVNN